MADILFKDTAGTEPAFYGDVIARIEDQSPNGNNALQATTAQRPSYTEGTGGATDRLVYDGVDDNMEVDFGAAFAGDVFQGTVNGVLHYAISTTGTWQNPLNALYRPDGGTLTATIAREGTLGDGDVAKVKTYLQEETGAGADFAGVTSMTNWFRGRSDITAIYSGDWDTSSVTDFSLFAPNCPNLATFDVSNWDTSSATNFRGFVVNDSSLTTLGVSNWNTSSVTTFRDFIRGTDIAAIDLSNWNTSSATECSGFALDCTSLTTVTVTGGTGNPFADSPCTNYTGAFTNTNLTEASIDAILVAIESAATSDGTFDQSGGSAPSATGEAAITTLRGRGWTVTVTGGF